MSFRELLRALDTGVDPSGMPGLSVRDTRSEANAAMSGGAFRHGPPRPVSHLNGAEIARPNRAARVLTGYTFMGRGIDIVETSRGCTSGSVPQRRIEDRIFDDRWHGRSVIKAGWPGGSLAGT